LAGSIRWGYTHKQRRSDKTVGTKFFAFQEYPLSSMNFKKWYYQYINGLENECDDKDIL
jgi:hypothetical protein